MQHGFTPQSIEFYRMPPRFALYEQTTCPSNAGFFKQKQLFTPIGAVLFGKKQQEAETILRIIPPLPSCQDLFQFLKVVFKTPLREKLVFFNWSKQQVLAALESYCIDGTPLPGIFQPGFATIESLSNFKQNCYEITSQIEHSDTRTYAWLAQRLKKPGAARAVGNALRDNPFPLFIPCHRVLKKDGKLGGYMGTDSAQSWQLYLKKTFLELENSHQQPSLFANHGSNYLPATVFFSGKMPESKAPELPLQI